jgi:cell division septum initiation protein DivIVA
VSADSDLDDRRAVSFAVVRRGYDQLQVDEVLADMAAQIETLRATTAELREREADLHAALDAAEYRARSAEAEAEELAAAAAAPVEAPVDVEPAPIASVADTSEGPASALDDHPLDPGSGDLPVDAPPLATRTGAGPDVATMVGEETARIIEAARHAAVEIGVRARADAERVAEEAREEARSIRADAEVQLLHRTREADDAVVARLLEAADAVQEAQARADAIVADAFTEAATLVLRAREEAEAVVAVGEQTSGELTKAAESARDELLGDLVRRRKVLRRQVEQLEAGRVRLRAAYAVVEGALTEATGELDRSVLEARDAAVAAAERSDQSDDPEVRAAAIELGADPDVVLDRVDPVVEPSPGDAEDDAGVDPSSASDVEGDVTGADHLDEPATGEPDPEPDPEPSPGPTAQIDLRGDDGAATPAAPDEDTSSSGAATDAVDEDTSSSGAATPTSAEPAATAAVAPVATAPAATEGARRRRRAPDPVEFEGRWSSAVRVLPPGPETAGEPLTGAASPGRGRSATEVFARLRAGDSHQPSLFDPAIATEPGAPASSSAAGDPVPAPTTGPRADLTDTEEAWLARRDAAFAPALRALRRRLKATLADDEDSLLEAVRRADPMPDTIDSLRDAIARRDDLAVALVASLATAAAAGSQLAADASGPTGPAVVSSDVEVDQIAIELADAVVAPLDERLERCIARYHRAVADASDPHDSTVDGAARAAATATLESAVKAAYRARRGAQVQVPTEHAVLLAGHRGLLAALEPGTPLRWVVAAPAAPPRRGGSGATADDADLATGARTCASCVAVADVGAGDPFGHGPLLPPARPGCRCAVAPVSAVVPRRR